MAPESGWLEDDFPFGFRPMFRGELLVLGSLLKLLAKPEMSHWTFTPWLDRKKSIREVAVDKITETTETNGREKKL